MPVPPGFQPCVPCPFQLPVLSGWPWLSQARLRQCFSHSFPTIVLLVLLHGLLLPGALQSHVTSQHFTQKIAPSWVTQTSEQGAAEHIITSDDAKLVTLPKSQVRQTGSEVVTVENCLVTVTLMCEEIK